MQNVTQLCPFNNPKELYLGGVSRVFKHSVCMIWNCCWFNSSVCQVYFLKDGCEIDLFLTSPCFPRRANSGFFLSLEIKSNTVSPILRIRNSLRYVSYKDRKAIIKDIKGIYQANNEEMAIQGFEKFKQNWASKYPITVKS